MPQERGTNINYTHEQNVPQTFSINNVSSYSLSCDIYNTPVTFLIDTGAGVSLLNKKVWDKVKPLEVILCPVTAHRLVEVDDIPIKVQGSVSLPVTIAGMQIQHHFIIAEQTTAEAILGLHFLEAHKCILDFACGKMLITDQTVSLKPNPSKTKMCCVRVTVTEKLVIPPQSEMEIMVHIHFKEAGTWLIEGVQFKEWPVCVARALVVPKDQVVPVL